VIPRAAAQHLRADHGEVPDGGHCGATAQGRRRCLVSGHVGDAAAAVAHKGDLMLRGSLLAHCLARLNRPAPRVALGQMLLGVVNSAIDISDGLVADLGHICERSAVGAAIEFTAIPCSAELMPLRGHALVTRAILAGGDDYELCFTALAGRRSAIESLSGQSGLALTRIGRIVAGKGVVVVDQAGKPMSVKDGGFDHFR
jgi:thiamine-monophosphate kinase